MQYSVNEKIQKTIGKEGFSIIELMVVIAVGGLIMAGAFGAMQWIGRAKITTTKQKLGSLDMVIEQYSTDIGQYPKELEELVEGPPQNSPLRKKWSGALAKESDLKDAWKREFEYELNPKGSKTPYTLSSLGASGTGVDDRIYSPASQE